MITPQEPDLAQFRLLIYVPGTIIVVPIYSSKPSPETRSKLAIRQLTDRDRSDEQHFSE